MIQVDPATVEYMLIMVGIIWVVLGLLAYICHLCQQEDEFDVEQAREFFATEMLAKQLERIEEDEA